MFKANGTDYIFREATIEDLQDIQDLSVGVYNDSDYTPGIFPQWLVDPRWYTFVAQTISEGVIAFVAFNIIDEGYSVVGRSARVSKSHRGKGIFRELASFGISFLEKKYPIKTEIATRATTILTSGHEVVKTLAVAVITCCPGSIEEIEHTREHRSESFANSLLPFNRAIENILKERQCNQNVFENDILTIEEEIFHLSCKADIEHLKGRSKLFFIGNFQEISGQPWLHNSLAMSYLNEGDSADGKSDSVSLTDKKQNNIALFSTDNQFAPTQLATEDDTVKCGILSHGLALLCLEGKETNLGLPLFSIDFYGTSLAQTKDTIVTALKVGFKEANFQKFCLSMRFSVDFEEEVCNLMAKMNCCDIIRKTRLHILQRPLH